MCRSPSCGTVGSKVAGLTGVSGVSFLAYPQSSPLGPIILVSPSMGVSVASVEVIVLGVGVGVGGAVTNAWRRGVIVCIVVVVALGVVLVVVTTRSLLICK
jgi:hypothetical protein